MRTLRVGAMLLVAVSLVLSSQVPVSASTSQIPQVPVVSQAATGYLVVRDDWLSSIAQRLCGSAARWGEIYSLNRGVVGSNPNLIYPGQRLTLPAGCSSTPGAGAPRSSSGWVSPLVNYRTTTCYEWRRALWVNGKLVSKEGLHTGIDMAAGGGVPIRAAAAGTVVRAGLRGGYGYAVEISHGGGITTLYAHQSRILVWSGRVSAGQLIGRVGATGAATGNHLHFGMYRNGQSFNPAPYLRARGVSIRGC